MKAIALPSCVQAAADSTCERPSICETSARVPIINRGAVRDEVALRMALIENIQRRDLDPIEEAEAYRKLNTLLGMTQTEIAQRINRSQATVAKTIGLLEMPEDVQDRIRRGELLVSHGVALLRRKGLPETV